MTVCSKVVTLTAPQRIEIVAEELPPPKEGELLCATIVSAISPGTELAAFRGLPPLRPSVGYPRLLGYCNVARVMAVGSRHSNYAVGDRVLSFAAHRSHFLIRENSLLYKLPEESNADHISLSYLFHLGYNPVLRSEVRAGSRVAVIGLGALGLTSVAVAAVAGASVLAVSDHEAPSEIAKGFGAVHVARRDNALAVDMAFGPESADTVILTTNSWSDLRLALRLAGRLGRIAVLGFPGRGEPSPVENPLDSSLFYEKQLRIEAVGASPEHPDIRGFCRFNERANMKWIAEQIEAGRLDPRPLISGRYEALSIEKAYRNLLNREHSPITYLLQWT